MPGWQRPISVSFFPASKRYGERGGEQAEIKAGISITAPVSCQEGAGTLQRRFLWGHASNASNQQVLDGSICIAAFFFSFFFSSVPGFIFPALSLYTCTQHLGGRLLWGLNICFSSLASLTLVLFPSFFSPSSFWWAFALNSASAAF